MSILFICSPSQIEIFNANIFDENETGLVIFKGNDDLTSFNIYDIVNGLTHNCKKIKDPPLCNSAHLGEVGLLCQLR